MPARQLVLWVSISRCFIPCIGIWSCRSARHEVPGIFGVDTRAITKRLRMEGEPWAIWVSCSTHLCNILTDLKWGSCQIIIIRNIRQKMTSFLPCCMGTSKVDLHYICIRPKHGKRWFPEAYVYILLVMIHVLLMFNMLPFLLSIFSRWVSGVVPFSDVCTSLPVHCCKDYGLFIAVREVYVCWGW